MFMNLKDALSEKLSSDEIDALNRSFEVIGDIGIIELDEKLLSKKKDIAKALVLVQRNIKVVLLKTDDVSGRYRVPKFEVIFESKDRDFSWVPKGFRPVKATETVHREHGCRFKIDPTTAYFSSKLAGERERIREQVKDGERILCLFAGVGPFPIVVARAKDVSITAVEINPDAVASFKENAVMNKVDDKIDIVLGDAGEVLGAIDGTFDRIMMPAPKNAADFLEGALALSKKGTIVHLYTFLAEEEIEGVGEVVSSRCMKAGVKVKILLVRKCGNIGPYHYRVVVDFLVL
ncbi:MAG: class I SAM-dependent methyltransferase family protein [archaeon]